jgi:anti-sigma factor RsiW
VEIVQHASEDDLERYVMQTLPDSETGPLEQHLLACSVCRDRLTATDEYVTAMKAAGKIRQTGTGE